MKSNIVVDGFDKNSNFAVCCVVYKRFEKSSVPFYCALGNVQRFPNRISEFLGWQMVAAFEAASN